MGISHSTKDDRLSGGRRYRNLTRQQLESALITNAASGRLEDVRFLLRTRRVDPNVVDDTGRTALIWAAANGHTAIARTLLAQPDINVEARDDRNQTAFDLAIYQGHPAISELIRDHLINRFTRGRNLTRIIIDRPLQLDSFEMSMLEFMRGPRRRRPRENDGESNESRRTRRRFM